MNDFIYIMKAVLGRNDTGFGSNLLLAINYAYHIYYDIIPDTFID